MDKQASNWLISLLRITRLAIHLTYGMLLAVTHPYLNQARQRRVLKTWSKQLLEIFNIGIQIEGQQPTRSTAGSLIIANHVSWLDIFVVNAIHPSRFIAKSEVREWPIIGWLCKRSGTIFIDRALRQKTSATNLRISLLLEQGTCVGLFPEGTTTDGKQVGHFHSSLIQPAIDAHARIFPIALRYQDDDGEANTAAPFIGDTTLVQSIWRIIRCSHLNALVVFTPELSTADMGRRMLARAAQDSIAQALQTIGTTRHESEFQAEPDFSSPRLSAQSSYALLVDPLLKHQAK
jgi:1-acyl-sn-glycerol-3-phosphate acyltransferase